MLSLLAISALVASSIVAFFPTAALALFRTSGTLFVFVFVFIFWHRISPLSFS